MRRRWLSCGLRCSATTAAAAAGFRALSSFVYSLYMSKLGLTVSAHNATQATSSCGPMCRDRRELHPHRRAEGRRIEAWRPSPGTACTNLQRSPFLQNPLGKNLHGTLHGGSRW